MFLPPTTIYSSCNCLWSKHHQSFSDLSLYLRHHQSGVSLYLLKTFRSCLSLCHLNFISVNIFVDEINSCYRNGLAGGRDMRCLSALYFFLRLLVCIVAFLSYKFLNVNGWSLSVIWCPEGTVFMVTALIIALIKPYQKVYMNYLDALLLSNLSLFCYVLTSGAPVVDLLLISKILPWFPISTFTLAVILIKLWILRIAKRVVSPKSISVGCRFKALSLFKQRLIQRQSTVSLSSVDEGASPSKETTFSYSAIESLDSGHVII